MKIFKFFIILFASLIVLSGCKNEALPEVSTSPEPAISGEDVSNSVPDIMDAPSNSGVIKGAVPGDGLGVSSDETRVLLESAFGFQFEDLGKGEYAMAIADPGKGVIEQSYLTVVSTDINMLYLVSYNCAAKDFTLSDEDAVRIDIFSNIVAGTPMSSVVLQFLSEAMLDPVVKEVANGFYAAGRDFEQRVQVGDSFMTLRFCFDDQLLSIEWSYLSQFAEE